MPSGQGQNNSTITSKRGRDDTGLGRNPNLPRSKQTKLNDYWLAVKTTNRFDGLPIEEPANVMEMDEQQPVQVKAPRPPPIFVHGVETAEPLKNLIKQHAGDDFLLKSLSHNSVKIQVEKIDAYRALVKALKDLNTEMHSYQPKEDRVFRVVLRNLHHSTTPEEITDALQAFGHCVKNVHNIRDNKTKSPLPMFFVDLKSSANNKEVYSIKRLLGYVVVFDPPRRKKETTQCTRCQRMGHTKAFCQRAPRCVKCTGSHPSAECTRKVRDNGVACVNCGGNHPANYKGCIVHRQLKEKKHPMLSIRTRQYNQQRRQQEQEDFPNLPSTNSQQRPIPHSSVNPAQSFADVARGAPKRKTNPTSSNSNSNLNGNGPRHAEPQAEHSGHSDMGRNISSNDFSDFKMALKQVADQMSQCLVVLTSILSKMFP